MTLAPLCLLQYRDIMMDAIDNIAILKKGRPSTEGTPVLVRVAPDRLKALDNWRRVQPDLPSRPEAIRRLVDLGIAGEPILRDVLRLMERLPQDDGLDRHIAAVRRLIEKGATGD